MARGDRYDEDTEADDGVRAPQQSASSGQEEFPSCPTRG